MDQERLKKLNAGIGGVQREIEKAKKDGFTSGALADIENALAECRIVIDGMQDEYNRGRVEDQRREDEQSV